MEAKIPIKFQLGGRTIQVLFSSRVASDTWGLSKFENDEIHIKSNDEMSKERQYAVFLHELVHFILDAMSEEDLNKNEKFVDVFAQFLHQALSTFRY